MSNSPGQNWAVYEANVQQYRVLSATVQSFLLTIGTLLFGMNAPAAPKTLLTMVTLFGIGHVLYVWIPVVYRRHLIIDYYKFQHDRKLDAEERMALEKLCSEEQYVSNRQLRESVNVAFFGGKLAVWRKTRRKLDWVVPGAYLALWSALAWWKILEWPIR